MEDSLLQKLREKYGRMSDEELKELLLAGKDEFEPEAFALLTEEARRRQVELGTEIAAAEQGEPAAPSMEREIEQENYAELMVINDQEDLEAVRKLLSKAGIAFYFQQISYTGRELPLALFVQQSRAGEAIGIFEGFKPKASIVLW